MNPRFFILFPVFLFLFSCHLKEKQSNLLTSGISRELAQYRKEQISDLRYGLSFRIPAETDQRIAARLSLNLNIHSTDEPLYLDFKATEGAVSSLNVNGRTVTIRHEQEHLIIPQETLNEGENLVEISFTAGDLSLNRSEDFLYTLLVPDRASTLFPCFDQPDLKAVYQLNLEVPADWEVLSSTAVERRETRAKITEYQFAETEKISSYLFSFVAGKFSSRDEALPIGKSRFLFRETDTEKISSSIEPIFDLHRQAIDFLKEYSDFDFPFSKLDFVAIPTFQYGGMEHVGAIQYREPALFLDQAATESKKLSRAKLIAHETAHMWFGDLVTMTWFNDVWMKEVFANFMADKLINPSFPHINHDLLFLLNHYPSAYAEDRTKGTNPIRQQLTNLSDAGSMYGGIIYDKAPIMMRQLELAMGEDAFRAGIRTYIAQYAYGNASWNDLIEILNKNTAHDLVGWSEVWVNQPGRPVLDGYLSYDNDNKVESFKISQHAEDGSDKLWPQQFEISFIYADTTCRLKAAIENREVILPEAVGLPRPEAIVYNSDGRGYGVFPLGYEELERVSGISDDVSRAYMYVNAYEQMLNQGIPSDRLFRILKKSLLTEQNELILGLLSSQINTLFWTFLTEKQRSQECISLETQLYDQLLEPLSANHKKVLFDLYQSIAYEQNGRQHLYQIWSKTTSIPQLKLNEDDYVQMATNLAIYGHPRTEEILENTLQYVSNTDKQKRFSFLLPSLSPDFEVRKAFFGSFREQKNREKEEWALAALSNIHHPLRQKGMIGELKLSLDLLQEIQATGDIFFPKRWLSASIGKYTSPEAYQLLQRFISTHPDYNPILLNKILQASDDLDRAQSIRKN